MGRGKCRWMMNQFCKKQWHFANLRTMTVLRIKNPRYCFTLRFPMTTLQLVWVVTLTQLRNPNRPYVLIRKNVRKINLMRASFFWQKIIVWEIRIFYWNFKSISPPMVDTCSVLLCFIVHCFVFCQIIFNFHILIIAVTSSLIANFWQVNLQKQSLTCD